jgi:uncharacterized SAM-binding protein YcdF (DUF218 family)
MIVPSGNLRREHSKSHWLASLMWLLLFVALAWTLWVSWEIHHVGTEDDARTADAIAVFGAAEYHGKPSPVLRARLEHTLQLYQRGIAPLIITLGGEDDMEHSEGGVGRDYLEAHGVPAAAIIPETLSASTEESVVRLAAIARERKLYSLIVVSDATHLFRIRELCRAQGLTVYTSPRVSTGGLTRGERLKRLGHEVLLYTLWKLHITPSADAG